MLQIEGTYTFSARRDLVWEMLRDPEILTSALPGGGQLEQVSENEYKGVMSARVGPIQGRFEGTVTLFDIRPPEGYRLRMSGKGAPGFVNGEGELRLEEQDGQTVLRYAGTVQFGGRIAGVGQRLLDSTARSLIRQSLEALDRQIQARAEAAAAEAPPPEVSAPSSTQLAAGVAKDVLTELVPPQQRKLVLAGALILLALLVWLLTRALG